MNRAAALLSLAAAMLAGEAISQSSIPPRKPRPDRTLTAPKPPPPPEEQPLRQRDATPPRPVDRADRVEPPRQEPAPSASPQAPDAPPAAAAPPTSAGSRARAELVVASTDITQGDEQRAFLLERGAQLLRRRALVNLGWVVSVYRLPPGLTPAAVSAELSGRWPDAMPEPNQRYVAFGREGAAAPLEYSRAMIAWPGNCERRVRIALLDGAVNADLPALRGRVHATSLLPTGTRPNYQHATALAALIVGRDAPAGLLPQAELQLGVILADSDTDPYTTTEWVLRGLDWVLGLSPRASALNLSFGGPRSAQIERAIRRVLEVMPVAAAGGNDGHHSSIYPAAHDGVIGVSAVDARGRRWPRANSGDHVSLAAPGAQVWTLRADGAGYYADGTSIATVFVTAALALRTSALPAPDWLRLHTRDAGAAGRDPEFGFGVLAMSGQCPGGES